MTARSDVDDGALAWLDRHEAEVPDPLLGRARAALQDAADPTRGVAGALAEAALRLLAEVAGASGAAAAAAGGKRKAGAGEERGALRATALDLLAADALLTWACEAAAAEGPEALSALTAAYGPARIGAVEPAGS